MAFSVLIYPWNSLVGAMIEGYGRLRVFAKGSLMALVVHSGVVTSRGMTRVALLRLALGYSVPSVLSKETRTFHGPLCLSIYLPYLLAFSLPFYVVLNYWFYHTNLEFCRFQQGDTHSMPVHFLPRVGK